MHGGSQFRLQLSQLLKLENIEKASFRKATTQKLMPLFIWKTAIEIRV